MEAEIGLDVYTCTCKLPIEIFPSPRQESFIIKVSGIYPKVPEDFNCISEFSNCSTFWTFYVLSPKVFHPKCHHHQYFYLQNQSQKFENWRKCITVIITWTLNNYFSLINWFKFTYFLKLWQNCSMDMSRDQDNCSWPLFNLHVS